MADIVSPEVRSRMMAGIRGKNTKPELLLRHGLHALGFRFRLHGKNLPGRPDIVFPKHRAVIFVHGCFWHGHDCPLYRLPATRTEFWRQKITRNKNVDIRVEQAIEALGWRQGVVWECALKGRHRRPLSQVIQKCAVWLLSTNKRMKVRGKMNKPRR
ncbi:MAG: very short patch repair endonuclease [Pseudorhodoplanes sp.]|jgi:DNA mismatch endonuclease (patch repair protein)|nr:very short patch repair endonuclease [Pseudorhodoplanes sp.]